jgi:hypothetical protein
MAIEPGRRPLVSWSCGARETDRPPPAPVPGAPRPSPGARGGPTADREGILSPEARLLAMPDLAQLQSRLLGRYPEAWVRHHLESFPSAYFAAFDGDEVDWHLGMMLELGDDRPVAVGARPDGVGQWWVDVVGYDVFQFLSTLCTLLAVRGLSIVEGRVFTSQPPPPGGRARTGGRAAGPGRRSGRGRRAARTGAGRSSTCSGSAGSRRGSGRRLGGVPGGARDAGPSAARRPVRRGPPPPHRPVRRGAWAATGPGSRPGRWSRWT